jgi:hypothetical protein
LRRRQHLREPVEVDVADAAIDRPGAFPGRIDLRFIDGGLLRDRQDENQDDRAEAAADAIEEGEAEDLGFATFGGDSQG